VYPPAPHSQATIENDIDDRLTILEDNMHERLTKLEQDIVDEQAQRTKLDEKVVQDNQMYDEQHLDHQLNAHLQDFLVEELTSDVVALEGKICKDLRKEFNDSIDAKGLDLQAKLKEFCEHRLKDIEEVVKQDVRNAFEDAF